MATLLTGLALADALYAQCLAPTDVWHRRALTPNATHDYPSAHLHRWRPWESLDAVAHLMERFRIEIGFNYRGGYWYVYTIRMYGGIVQEEPATPFPELPTAIARLALRLHAAEQKERNR